MGPAPWLLLFAVPQELQGLARARPLQPLPGEGDWPNLYKANGALVAATGAGAGRAAQATARLLEGYRPRGVLALGFAGALGPLQAGTLVVAREVLPAPGGAGEPIPISGDLQARLLEAARRCRTPVVEGALVTATSLVARPREKARLGRATGALAVDMESLAVVREARRAGVPVGVVRAVLDEADEALPPFAIAMAHGAGPWLVAPLALQPWRWPAMARLGLHFRRAREALARFSLAWLGLMALTEVGG